MKFININEEAKIKLSSQDFFHLQQGYSKQQLCKCGWFHVEHKLVQVYLWHGLYSCM